MFNNLIYNASKKSHNFFQRCRTAINSCIDQNTIKSGSPCFDRSKKYLFFAKLQLVEVWSTFFIQQLFLNMVRGKWCYFCIFSGCKNRISAPQTNYFSPEYQNQRLWILWHDVWTTCTLNSEHLMRNSHLMQFLNKKNLQKTHFTQFLNCASRG